jgi:ABC-type lipoprotein export system ATPase subunit
MVTHDATLAKIASRIVTIKDGQIESDKKRWIP